jgi:hypothetical protein
MNVKLSIITVITAIGLSCTGIARADVTVLARIDELSSADEPVLTVYEYLQDGSGMDYALVLTDLTTLDTAGYAYRIIDADAGLKAYALAMLPPGARRIAGYPGTVYYDDGKQLIITAAAADAFADAGYEVKVLVSPVKPMQKLEHIPLIRRRIPGRGEMVSLDFNILVQNIIDQVYISNLYVDLAKLSGEQEVTVGGQPLTIASRHTRYGTPFMKDTEYAYEWFDMFGLNPEYQYWEANGYSNRNVIATRTGQIHPDEIVLITAHIDDMPSGTYAPGADDNGSGSVGVMAAAEIFSQYQFDRTIRFVLFTGEEQGLLGSSAYADMVYNLGETIVACYNMDMLAWDNDSQPIVDIHTRRTNDVGYAADLAIATAFVDVVNTYGLSSEITPEIVPDAIWASDHSRFWNKGYPAVLAIEDWQDFNDFYHTTNDALRNVNMPYYTAFAKASLGTCAQIGGVLVPEAAIMPVLAIAFVFLFRKK